MSSHVDQDQAVVRKLSLNATDKAIWARVGRLFDGISSRSLRNANLVFDSTHIRYVGQEEPPSNLLDPDQAIPDVELPDHLVLPGLIDAHTHLFLDGSTIDLETRKTYLKRGDEWLIDRARRRWPKILQCGVMAVRDAGDKNGVGLALARECAQTRGVQSTNPYIDSPGAAIHRQGRYGSFMSRPLEDHDDPQACVFDRVESGADRIKLIATGIIDFKSGCIISPPQMSVSQVDVLVKAAQQHGRQCFAHASGVDGIENVIQGRVKSIEHGYFVTSEQLSRMRDAQIAWVPTLAPVQLQIDRGNELGWDDVVLSHLRRIIENHCRMLVHAQEIGVRIIAGSDAGSCGVPHGIGLLRELELMQQAGISTAQVLGYATGRSAGHLDFREPIGRLAADHRARMIFTRFNPLKDVANLRLERIVVFDGQALLVHGEIDQDGL